MDVNIWRETYAVRSYEVQPDGFATMQTICNFLQEAASNHATALNLSVEQLAERSVTWVLGRLRVQMDGYPQWREKVHVDTWPSGEHGLSAHREFVIRDEGGDEIGRGTSAWLLIDLTRRRPMRMPDYVKALRLPDRPAPLPGGWRRLAAPHDGEETTFRVRYSDLDVNQHVNNVCYVDWAVEAVPEAVMQEYEVREMEIHFRAETGTGATVRSRAARVPDAEGQHFRHRLYRAGDAQDVALAYTVWTARTP